MQILKNFLCALAFIAMLILAGVALEAYGDTECDESAGGYSCYDYDRGEFIDIDEDPTGGYDVYDYGTREYLDIDENSSGGFTIYGDTDD